MLSRFAFFVNRSTSKARVRLELLSERLRIYNQYPAAGMIVSVELGHPENAPFLSMVESRLLQYEFYNIRHYIINSSGICSFTFSEDLLFPTCQLDRDFLFVRTFLIALQHVVLVAVSFSIDR